MGEDFYKLLLMADHRIPKTGLESRNNRRKCTTYLEINALMAVSGKRAPVLRN
jgi:hypothetical protein